MKCSLSSVKHLHYNTHFITNLNVAMQVCSRELAASLLLLVFILIHYIEVMWHKNVMHFTEKLCIYTQKNAVVYTLRSESHS